MDDSPVAAKKPPNTIDSFPASVKSMAIESE